ncbi:ECF transporter S component [Candidatus Bathyarchaeota archaeon]|nr:ECF transporter S component [Candidatus Bathyarchaeota archaeon]
MVQRAQIILSVAACLLVLFGAALEMDAILASLGISSVFSPLSLSDANKVNLAFYLTLSVGSSAMILWSAFENQRRQARRGGIIAFLAVILCFGGLMLPLYFGYPYSTMAFLLMVAGILVTGFLGYTEFKASRIEGKEVKFLTPLDTAIIAVFSAITAVLTGTTGIMLPSPTGGYTHIGDTAIYVAALLFGSKIGGLVGVIGPVAADIFVGYPRWFVTVFAHGAQGFISGLGKGRSLVIQVALLLLAGFVMSSVYFIVNVYIKGFPLAVISYARDFFGQSLVSMVISIVLAKGVERALPSLRR